MCLSSSPVILAQLLLCTFPLFLHSGGGGAEKAAESKDVTTSVKEEGEEQEEQDEEKEEGEAGDGDDGGDGFNSHCFCSLATMLSAR